MSTNNIYESVIAAAQRTCPAAADRTLQHLDIGAGEGTLIGIINKRMRLESAACDFHVERFKAEGVQVQATNLDHDSLPYADNAFDLVTCSEVIEHLENYRRLLREAFRVMKPGATLVVTTPNVLNALSRVKYVFSGFANLFGPLPAKNDKLYSTGGHITPISYFYLAHSLIDAGFGSVALDIDKVQKTSLFWLIIMSPVIYIGWLWFWIREKGRYKTITPENSRHVALHISKNILLGRTIVVSCVK